MPFRLHPLSLSLILALGLSACGGGGGIGSSGTGARVQGVMVDDRVAGATVFCDANGNGTLDSSEASVVTGDDGSYSFSSCDSPVVSVPGTGYDKTTLKAPKAAFRTKTGSSVISPLTTMQLASGLSDTEFAAVLTKLGLSGIGNAGAFDPTDDTHGKGSTAAALIKVLNEIAEVVESAGGDPKIAFAAAAAALVTQAQALPAGTDLFAGTTESDAALLALIKAVATAGFTADTGATWSPKAKANAADLLGEGLKLLTKRIKSKTRYADLRDDFSNGAVGGIISETDLDDDVNVEDSRGRCRDEGNYSSAQYVYADGDAFTLVGPTLSGGSKTVTLAEFGTGVDLVGQKLGELTSLRLPLKGKALALHKNGTRVQLALEVSDTSTGRLLQMTVDKLRLKRGTLGAVTMSVDSGAELVFYARDSGGVEIGTGKDGFKDFDTSMLSSGADGIALDLKKLATGMLGRFASDANNSILNDMLSATGNFTVKLVVTETDLRHADGSRFAVGRIEVKIPGEPGKVAERISGTAVTGRLSF